MMAHDDVYVLQSLGPSTPWRFPAHRHEGWCEVQFVVEGTLNQTVNGRAEDLSAGDLLLVREDDEHELHGRDFLLFNLLVPDHEWRRLEGYLGDDRLLAALAARERPPRLHLAGAARDRLAADLRQLFSAQGSGAARAQLGRVLLDLLPRLAGSPAPTAAALVAPAGAPAWLRDLLDELDHLLDQGVDTAAIATRARISPEHLSRTVRRHLGMTPTDLLNRRRLERAALLLSHTDRPVLGIALDLGYGSASVFSRAFHAHHGVAPRVWRKRNGVGWQA